MSAEDVHDGLLIFGITLRSVLSPFEGRSIDESLLTEMTKVPAEELASVLDDDRIRLVRESWGIRVEIHPLPRADALGADSPTDAGFAGLEAVKAALAA